MRTDSRSGEEIRFEHAPSVKRLLPLHPYDGYPLESVLIVVAALAVESAGWLSSPLAQVALLFLGPLVVVAQLRNTRDFLTTGHVVRQRGIFGERRATLPIGELTKVIAERTRGLTLVPLRGTDVFFLAGDRRIAWYDVDNPGAAIAALRSTGWQGEWEQRSSE